MQNICITVNITGDDVTETNEHFTIVLTLGTLDIFQRDSTVIITIIDDGECVVKY